MARNRIQILLEAQGNVSAELNKTSGQVDNFAAKIQNAFSGQGAADLLGGISPQLGTLAAGALGVGAAIGAWQLGEKIGELGRLGAESQRVEQSFQMLASQAGASGNAMLAAMQKASNGTISNADLMLSANRAMALGVADSADEMAQLLQVAIARGKALGVGAGQAFNDLVTGLGRGSAEILDNLGIMVDAEATYAAYAESVGKAAGSLSKAEKGQALMNAVMAQSKGLIADNANAGEDLASKFERMDSSIANAKDALGQLFAPAVAVVAQNIADATNLAVNGIRGIGDALDENAAIGNITIVEQAITAINQSLEMNRQMLAQLTPGTAEYNAEQQVMWQNTGLLRDRLADLTTAKAQYFATLQQLYPAQEGMSTAINRTSVEAGALLQVAGMNASIMAEWYAGTISTSEAISAAGATLYDAAAAASEYQARIAALAGTYPAASDGADNLGTTTKSFSGYLLEANPLLDQLQVALAYVPATSAAAANGLNTAAAAMDKVSFAAAQLSNLVSEANARLASFQSNAAASMAAELVSTQGASAALAYYDKTNAQLNQQVGAWKDAGYSMSEIESVLLPGYVSGLRKSTNEIVKVASGTRSVGAATRAARSDVEQLSQEYEGLRGKVGSVLSGALGDDLGGIKLDGLLPRQDSVAENARRLADVAVNGFSSPWAAYFEQQFPALWAQISGSGDVQTAAAQMLKDFQDGLRPELLDKGRAKELVKRAITGDQNMKVLTDEISQELAAELGISIQEAKAAAQSALGGESLLPGIGADEAGGNKISVTPVVDTSLLPSTPISLTGLVTTVAMQDGIDFDDIQIEAVITRLRVAEKVEKPGATGLVGSISALQIEATAKLPEATITATISAVSLQATVSKPDIDAMIGYIGTLRLLASAELPEPVLAAGATITAVGIRSDATVPSVDGLTGNIGTLRLLASAELPEPVLAAGATITAVNIRSDAAVPSVDGLTGNIGTLRLLASAELPEPVLTAGATITAVNIRSDAAVPSVDGLTGYIGSVQLLASAAIPDVTVTLSANIKPILPQAFSERPLALSANIFPILPTSLTAVPLSLSANIKPNVLLAEEDKALIQSALGAAITPSVTPLIILPTEEQATIRTALGVAITPTVVPVIDTTSDIAATGIERAGFDIALGVGAALVSANLGGLIVAEMAAAQQRIYGAGFDGGVQYAGGFLQGFEGNVPQRVLEILASLLMPLIGAKQAKEQSKKVAN